MNLVDEKGVKNPPEIAHQETVIITVDNKKHKIHPGRTSVSDIKKIGEVPLAYTLVQVLGGKLIPLPDEGFINIRGGEEFKSHVKDGANS